MADKVKIELNHAAVAALLKSPAIQGDLARRAKAIAAAAAAGGGTFDHETMVGANRARASVRTADFEARRAEATTRALTRAIDAGRK